MIVPSSTSSSNARLPGGRSGRILAAGLIVTLALVCLYEVFLRSLGYGPGLTDDRQLWSLTLSKVERNDPDEIVLIGASRTQADIDGDVFATSFSGRKPRQLAIAGDSPLPVLGYLAQDESFKGLVICDVMGIYFFTGMNWKTGLAAEYVGYARDEWSWDRAATRLRVFLDSHLALRAPDASPSPGKVLEFLGLRRLARQNTIVDRDRYTHIDRRPEEVPLEATLELARLTEKARPASQERFDRDLAVLNDIVRKIVGRGGRVVFTVLPVSGQRREAEEHRFPRAEFWERFASRVDAPTIAYDEYPELAGYICHDGSHLTTREAPSFTQSFASVLKAKLGPARGSGEDRRRAAVNKFESTSIPFADGHKRRLWPPFSDLRVAGY
jgi:hypothetical protein